MSMQNLKIALTTDRTNLPEYSDKKSQHGELLHYLKSKHLQVSAEVWDDDSVDWSQYNVIIMKSTWDYTEKIEKFHTWLNHLEKLHIRVLNPLDAIRWNADKKYLKEIEQRGAKIIPTIWLDAKSTFDVEKAFQRFGSKKIIVKPRISADARHTYSLTKEEAISKKDEIQELLKDNDFMVQPFLNEIQTKGEWSLVFFDTKYSHTVVKTPKSGDFRVQSLHGGASNVALPSSEILTAAQFIADNFARGCLYARVDGVEVNGQFLLMELEMIEPNLFIMSEERFLENYYKALQTYLQ